jgi:hypothetical protein
MHMGAASAHSFCPSCPTPLRGLPTIRHSLNGIRYSPDAIKEPTVECNKSAFLPIDSVSAREKESLTLTILPVG